MLVQRILTALVLIPLMALMLFFVDDVYWLVFAALISGLTVWEYGKIARLPVLSNLLLLLALFATVYGVQVVSLPEVVPLSQASPQALTSTLSAAHHAQIALVAVVPLAVVTLLFWLILAPVWLAKKFKPNKVISFALGWVMFTPFLLALIDLHHIEFYQVFLPSIASDASADWLLLAIMVTVWVADTAAYFVGRAIGRYRLASVISPGKSWEGAAGGLVAVMLYTYAVSGYLHLGDYLHVLLPFSVMLALISIEGDLLESWLKRMANVKDSGRLLPGHGGVYDRLDSLVAVLGVCWALLSLLRFVII